MRSLAALRGVGEYVRQVGKSMPTLVRRAVMPCGGGYLYQMGGASWASCGVRWHFYNSKTAGTRQAIFV